VASPRCVVPAHARHLTRRALLAATAGLASLAALAAVPAGSALADPKVSAAAAQAQLQALSDKAEILVEKYDAAQEQLTAAQHRLTAQQAAIAMAQQTVDGTQTLVDAVVASAYKSGNLDGVQSVLFAKDPQTALNSAGTMQRIAASRSEELRQATAARNKLAQTKTSATQALIGVQALEASLKAQQKTIDALVAQQQAVLNAQTADAAVAVRASRSQTRVALPAVRSVAAPVSVPLPAMADGRAAAAVRFAFAQLNKPYHYGAAGNATFDCSGLTMRAWGAAGVSLGHNAAGQYASTRHVAVNALQPGDLVFFGRPIHHVGIYIGGGQMIEAPYTGARVRVTSFGGRRDFAGASRP
jgi:peptidoglycan DL-endopeptidase CwlO